MFKSGKTLIATLAVVAVFFVASATMPDVLADRCDEPSLRSVKLDDGDVVLRVYPDDSAGCWPEEAEVSYGRSSSASGKRIKVAFTNIRLRIDEREFEMRGRIYIKVRIVNESGEKSKWSRSKRVRLPECESLPKPRIHVEPEEYFAAAATIEVSWSGGGAAEKHEVQVYADGTWVDGDRTRRDSLDYQVAPGAELMEFRVRGLTDCAFSEWSNWGSSRKATSPTPTPTPTPETGDTTTTDDPDPETGDTTTTDDPDPETGDTTPNRRNPK